MKGTLGIIGFGRFGQLAAKYLKRYFKISVSDIKDRKEEARCSGVVFESMKECASKDVVLFCVPISDLENVLLSISGYLREGSLVMDVCSVKVGPVKVMRRLVPKTCHCIGTHPLFGPDTVNVGLKGNRIVLCPVRSQRLKEVKGFLEQMGLEVILTTPEDHDRQMARSLAMIHLLGKALLGVGVEKIELATPTHERLMELVGIVKNDSNQLFLDMQNRNRFARTARKELIKELERIDRKIET